MEQNNNEEKKASISEKVANFKELLSDKRNKAIFKLVLYFIFFLIIIICIRVSNTKNNNSNYEPELLPQTITESIKTLQTMKNYNLSIKYDIIDLVTNNYILELKNENNQKTIIFNGITYYNDEFGWYQMVDNIKQYENNQLFNDLSLIEPNKIYNYLLKSSYQYKKEDINNNISINSKLSINEFALINNNIVDNNESIIIETYENNNQIIDIYLDLTNYYKINNPNIYSYKITVTFNNN